MPCASSLQPRPTNMDSIKPPPSQPWIKPIPAEKTTPPVYPIFERFVDTLLLRHRPITLSTLTRPTHTMVPPPSIQSPEVAAHVRTIFRGIEKNTPADPPPPFPGLAEFLQRGDIHPPESMSFLASTIEEARSTLTIAIATATELLAMYDSTRGRTLYTDRLSAHALERDISRMRACANSLISPDGIPYPAPTP